MKQDKNKYALSSVKVSELEDDQWFPNNPAKPVTKRDFIIGLLDEFAILILIIIIVYFLVERT